MLCGVKTRFARREIPICRRNLRVLNAHAREDGRPRNNSRSGAHPGRWRWGLGQDLWRCDRLSGQNGRILNKETKDESTSPRRARSKQSTPALLPERFADVLIGRPYFPARSRQCQPDARKSVRIAKIGDLERRDLVPPHVSGKLVHRWYSTLGEVAIPLSPQRLLLIGEVESVDDVAALPAVVARWLRPPARVSEVRDLTQPRSVGVNRVDVERRRAGPQTAPGDSSSETTRATRRALPRAINSSGF